MMPYLRVFFTGLMVSFLGALPLGTVNLTAMQIAVSSGVAAALLFTVGLLLADVFYIYITLLTVQWLQRHQKVFRTMEWITIVIILLLAIATYYSAWYPSEQKNVLLHNSLPRWLLGLLLNGLNPMQVPFWFGWITVLMGRQALQPRWSHYHLFTAGACVELTAATLLFVFAGSLVAEKIASHQRAVSVVVGTIFLGTALFYIWRLQKRKKLNDAPTDES